MTPLDLLILALFAWYVSFVLIKTDGPLKLFLRLRTLTTIGGLLLCIWCLCPWVAALGYLLMQTALFPIVYIGAAAGGAMFLHRYSGGEFS